MVVINIDEQKCTGCGDCIKTCPPEILYINGNKSHVKEYLVPECLGCQSCVVVCPEAAITITD